MQQQPNPADFERTLEAVVQHVYASQALTRGQVLHTPALDKLVDRLGCQWAGYPADYRAHPGTHLIVATEFYAAGGHNQIARQLQQATRAPVLCTDLHARYQNGDPAVVKLDEPTLVIKEIGLRARVAALREWILALRPETIWILAHHHDGVVAAGLNSSLRCRKVFIHHADLNVSLGSARRDYLHLDLDFLSVDTIAPFCRSVGKVAARVVPAPGSTGIEAALSSEQALQRLRQIGLRSRLRSITTGTPNKFRFEADFPLSLEYVLGRVFASGVVERHLHIGMLPEATVQALQRSATAHGVDFQHTAVSRDFVGDLLRQQADVYIGSFPTGGGTALNTALGCGLFPLCYARTADAASVEPGWSFALPNVRIPGWTSAQQLVERLLDRSWLRGALADIEPLTEQAWQASAGFAQAVQRALSDTPAPAPRHAAPANPAAFHAARKAYRASYAPIVRAWRQQQAGAAEAAKPPEAWHSPRCLHEGSALPTPTAVLLHLHYPELWQELSQALSRLGDCDLYISLTAAAASVAPLIVKDFPRAHVIEVANRGRDVLPRLQLARRAIAAKHTQWLWLHGKRSPHLELVQQMHIGFLQHRNGDQWRRELLEALIGHHASVTQLLRDRPEVGFVGPSGFWLRPSEDSNWARTVELARRMGLSAETAGLGYFAGSMFWCRPQALEPLLRLNLQPEAFEAEGAQLEGTLAHAVARLFSLSAQAAGFDVEDTAGQLLARGRRPVQPWMPEGRLLGAEPQCAAETSAGWSPAATPEVALAMIVTRPSMPGHSTGQSVAAQWPSSKPLRLLHIDGSAATEQALRDTNRQLLECGADWVGLIEAEDRLAPDALFRIQQAVQAHPQWQLLYTDEDVLTADGQHLNPHLKPDFNLDYLRSLPYVGGLMLVRRDLFQAIGGFDAACEGAEDYDLALRAWEQLQRSGAGEAAIGHVPEVLYHRLQGSGHTRKSVPELLAAGEAALRAHFARLGIAAQVQPGPFPPSYRVRWPLPETRPLVSIIIPTRDQLPMLQRCIESVIEKTR